MAEDDVTPEGFDIRDPLENIRASREYAKRMHGSLADWAKPGGYERGTGMAYLHPEERVIPQTDAPE